MPTSRSGCFCACCQPVVGSATGSRRTAQALVSTSARPRLQNTWPGEGGHRRKAGRPSFAITPTVSHRSTCSSSPRFRFSCCMDFWSCGIPSRRTRRFRATPRGQDACSPCQSCVGFTIGTFGFEHPTGIRLELATKACCQRNIQPVRTKIKM